ncbi:MULTISPECIES: carbohydrate kinase family protein [Marivita]|uniref:Sugar kinase n=1 Tax=Marivita cryptomonadis TaxID=505252 RepID=A0A9Q2NWN2_9RHOB|nr:MULTISPECIES: sugar kinase [Marivita]MCR9167804.1 sugar kinase [Paracoccaceae bacterium]MBM2320274.1 sugar kinase [Marivita cryptomonadis]MBM2329853.1 sugar kinase [Marivita cryptomonadis]MBM2339441.1 sugar kinase [Marivita cryptomonadis]MBM2344099.1 sugar kinase [Marivita cryptomonadis]
MTFDYTSMGFHTFDALCRPVTEIPPGGNTYFVDEFTIAVSGAAGSAAIVAAKHGLNVQAVGGVGNDLMGDWVLRRFGDFGVDTEMMQRIPDMTTSSSVVTTRPDGARPALHKRGATAGFYITDDLVDRVLDTTILHIGGVGLMDAMDKGRNAELLAEAKARGITTTLDVFASTPEDFPLIRPLLAHTDYFMPSEEEAMALSGMTDYEQIAAFLLDQGVGAVILTLGADGAMYRDQRGQKIDIPSYKIDVVCTCGCGDCFNAGFATGLHLGRSIDDCIRFGQASSAQNAMGLGSQAVVSSLKHTIAFMETTPTRA